MPGMDLRIGGGIRSSVQLPATSQPAPRTAAEAAFGGSASASAPSRVEIFKPNDAFGISFWWGVAALAGLLIIRHSLPG